MEEMHAGHALQPCIHNENMLLSFPYTQINHKRSSVRPVKATILNLAFEERIMNLDLVAYLPSGQVPDKLNPDSPACRHAKKCLTSKCLNLLTQSLKAACNTDGIQVVAPNGQAYTAYPTLASYVADDPEAKDVHCISGGPKSYHKCEMCWIQSHNLGVDPATLDDEELHKRRYENEQKNILQGIRDAPAKATANDISVELSTAPVEPATWGWLGSDEDVWETSSTTLTLVEVMHTLDLGIWLYLIKHLPAALDRLIGPEKSKKAIATINERLRHVPTTTGMRVPCTGPDNPYIPNSSGIQAQEHRTVSEVMPHLVEGIHPDVTELFCG